MSDRLLYTVMPDYGGAYAWVKDEADTTARIGANCADNFGGVEHSWDGHYPISEELARAFARWQLPFEKKRHGDAAPEGGWASFHAEGLALAARLQAELGDLASVRYRWPREDPGRQPDMWLSRVVRSDK